MRPLPDQPEVTDALKAAAFIAGVPVDQVKGYILTVIHPDDERMVTSNLCCRPHITAVMADVLADTISELADNALHIGAG